MISESDIFQLVVRKSNTFPVSEHTIYKQMVLMTPLFSVEVATEGRKLKVGFRNRDQSVILFKIKSEETVRYHL